VLACVVCRRQITTGEPRNGTEQTTATETTDDEAEHLETGAVEGIDRRDALNRDDEW